MRVRVPPAPPQYSRLVVLPKHIPSYVTALNLKWAQMYWGVFLVNVAKAPFKKGVL